MITFPCASQAAATAAKLVRLKTWPYARAAVRQIDGRAYNVVLLIGEHIATVADLDPDKPTN